MADIGDLGSDEGAADACRTILCAFVLAVDRGEFREFDGLLTYDFRFVRGELTLVGRSELVAFLEARLGIRSRRHIVTPLLVRRIAPQEMEIVSNWIAFLGNDTGTKLVAGEYVDRFRLEHNGWRVAERVNRIDFS